MDVAFDPSQPYRNVRSPYAYAEYPQVTDSLTSTNDKLLAVNNVERIVHPPAGDTQKFGDFRRHVFFQRELDDPVLAASVREIHSMKNPLISFARFGHRQALREY